MNAETPAKLEATIIRLTPKIAGQARKYASSASGLDADDLYQNACLQLIEKTNDDDSILDQQDAFILQAIKWNMGHDALKSRIYTKYVEAEPRATNDEGDEIDWLETLISDNGNTPEKQMIRKEQIEKLQAAIRTLSPDNQKVVEMLLEGHKQKEIAEALNITSPAVTQRKAYIASQLRAML